MWNKIINPNTKQYVPVNSKLGKQILQKYIQSVNMKGGSSASYPNPKAYQPQHPGQLPPQKQQPEQPRQRQLQQQQLQQLNDKIAQITNECQSKKVELTNENELKMTKLKQM